MESIGETLLNFITHHPQRDREKKKHLSCSWQLADVSPVSPSCSQEQRTKQIINFTGCNHPWHPEIDSALYSCCFSQPFSFFLFFYHVERFVECFFMRSFLKHGRNCLVFVAPCRTEDEAVLFYFLITPPDLLSDGGSGGSPTSGIAERWMARLLNSDFPVCCSGETKK